MPLDHQESAAELQRAATVIEQMADIIGSLAAHREATHSKSHLLGLADWHLDQHTRQQKSLNLHRAQASNAVFGNITKNKHNQPTQ